MYTVFYFRNIVRITFWRSSLILTIKCFVWCFMWVWKYSYSIAEKYITRVSYTYDPIIFIFHWKIKRCIKIIFFNQKEFWYTSNLIPKITSIFWFPKSGLISKIYPLYIIFRYLKFGFFISKILADFLVSKIIFFYFKNSNKMANKFHIYSEYSLDPKVNRSTKPNLHSRKKIFKNLLNLRILIISHLDNSGLIYQKHWLHALYCRFFMRRNNFSGSPQNPQQMSKKSNTLLFFIYASIGLKNFWRD